MEKKEAFDAVIGVLGVLFTVRFGGGVKLPLLTSAEGTGKEEMRSLNVVPSGNKFKGGSLIGWRFFLLECCTTGALSGSDPAPTVKPLLCLIDPALFCGLKFAESGPKDSRFSFPVALALEPGVDAYEGSGGMLIFDDGVANVKLLRSGSFGDSKAFGIAGTGGTSSSSPAAEL